jgi:hypothetical protein
VLGNDLMDNYVLTYFKQVKGAQVHPKDCREHKFLEIVPFSDLSESQKSMFDSHTRLKDEFFQTVLERYALLLDDCGATSSNMDPRATDASTQPPSASTNHPDDSQQWNPSCQDDIIISSTQPPETRPHMEAAAALGGQVDKAEEPGDPGREMPCEPGTEAGMPDTKSGPPETKACTPDSADESEGTGNLELIQWDSSSDAMAGESDDSNYSDDSKVDNTLDDLEREFGELPRAKYLELIAKALSFLLRSATPKRDSMVVRANISSIAKRVGPWPPLANVSTS